jgi:hypothetical protein
VEVLKTQEDREGHQREDLVEEETLGWEVAQVPLCMLAIAAKED